MKVLKITLILFAFFSLMSTNPKAEVPPAQPGKRLIVHKVGRGEELHLLAGYYLLNAREWDRIYTWNSDMIENKNRIYPGQELIIYVDNDWNPPYDLDAYLKEIGRR
jgi:hypothetical protein